MMGDVERGCLKEEEEKGGRDRAPRLRLQNNADTSHKLARPRTGETYTRCQAQDPSIYIYIYMC